MIYSLTLAVLFLVIRRNNSVFFPLTQTFPLSYNQFPLATLTRYWSWHMRNCVSLIIVSATSLSIQVFVFQRDLRIGFCENDYLCQQTLKDIEHCNPHDLMQDLEILSGLCKYRWTKPGHVQLWGSNANRHKLGQAQHVWKTIWWVDMEFDTDINILWKVKSGEMTQTQDIASGA